MRTPFFSSSRSFSWHDLYQARASLTDDEVQAHLASTALFRVLDHCRHELDAAVQEVPLVLHPTQALLSFELTDLRARMPDRPEAELEALLGDAAFEASVVERAIDEGGLVGFFDECKRLVALAAEATEGAMMRE